MRRDQSARNPIGAMNEPAVDRTPDTGQQADALSAHAAAELLGVHERTIRRAIARGELPAVKRGGVYQIASEDLRRYEAEREPPAQLAPTIPIERPHLIPFPLRKQGGAS